MQDRDDTYNDSTDLELDVLLLYYNFSDQWGRVDTLSAAKYAASKYGLLLDHKRFRLEQKHIDLLMDKGMIYDTRLLFNKIHLMPFPSFPKKKRKK